MAQFVVIWSIFLYASCLLLLCAAQGPQEQYQQQQQQQQPLTQVPLVSDNVVEMLVPAGGQASVGVAGSVGGVVAPSASSVAEQERVYHPAAVTKPRIIDQYDHRSLDGHFEYRYLLSNGEARYERAYWLPAGKSMVLARKGYYSYPISNDNFLTVFYTADQNGYRQDSTTYSRTQPHLPRSIGVPEYVPQSIYAAHAPVKQHPAKPHVHHSTTTPRPFVPSTNNPFLQLKPSAVPQVSPHQSVVGHGKPVPGQQSQSHHSSVHSSSSAHSSVGGHVASGVHSSTGGHHSGGIPSSTNIVSSSPVHHSSLVHSQAEVYPADPHQSAAHSSSGGHHAQSEVHHTVPIQSAAHATSSVHSSLIHSHTGVHSVAPAASVVHSSIGAYSPPSVHSPSAVPSSTGMHSAAVHHPRPTVRPTNQVHNSHHYQSASHGSSAHSSAGVHPTVAPPTVPVQSWHYSF